MNPRELSEGIRELLDLNHPDLELVGEPWEAAGGWSFRVGDPVGERHLIVTVEFDPGPAEADRA